MSQEVFFAGIGAAGSLYYEPYAQIGFRRLALDPLPVTGDYLSFSSLGRYGRPYSGIAFPSGRPAILSRPGIDRIRELSPLGRMHALADRSGGHV